MASPSPGANLSCVRAGGKRTVALAVGSGWAGGRASHNQVFESQEVPMARMKFGAFLAPHHPIGEHPMLQMRNDIRLAAELDALGYDEFWVGEHHSTGGEMIASPEMCLAGVAQHTHRIRLGTGVVSLPYHHPFNVAQRMVQLDHMSGGRPIFGTGARALPAATDMLGREPRTPSHR